MSILYVVMIFFNPISVYIPYSNYLDEFICITLLFMALSKLCIKNDKVRMNEKFQMFILIVLISAIGFISNIVYGYMNGYSVIARDFPPEYMDPLASGKNARNLMSDLTISIHHYSASWTSNQQRLKRRITRIIGEGTIIKIKSIIGR